MFLAFSGYFAAKSVNKGAIDYYRGRVWRIVLPYAIWTVLYIAIRGRLTMPSLREIFEAFVFGVGIGIGYYIIVLLQYMLITPLLMRIRTVWMHVFLLISLTVLGLVFSYFCRIWVPESFFSTFPGSALIFLVWYPFYHFGFFVSRHWQYLSFSWFGLCVGIAWLVLAIGLALVEAYHWAAEGFYAVGVSQIKLTSYVASLVVIVFAFYYAGRDSWLNLQTPFAWLGRRSYAIFLIHLLFLGLAIKVCQPFESLYSFQPAFVLITAVLALGGCIGIIFLIEAALPRKISRLLLG